MHCARCLKAAAAAELEPTGPFREDMCSECRAVFNEEGDIMGALLDLEARHDGERCMHKSYPGNRCIMREGHDGAHVLGNTEYERTALSLQRQRQPYEPPVIDGRDAFGNDLVEFGGRSN